MFRLVLALTLVAKPLVWEGMALVHEPWLSQVPWLSQAMMRVGLEQEPPPALLVVPVLVVASCQKGWTNQRQL
jgi:hypothetical protein